MTASTAISIVVAGAVAPLSVSLGLPSGTLNFSQDQAADLGDYVGPFVHQKCFRQRQGPWTVYFRPDADGSRGEVVVEYGCDFTFTTPTSRPLVASGVAPVNITSPYTATISGGGLAQPIAVHVPYHWWMGRWRWQSSERSFKQSYANLVAMKAVPPMSANAVWNTAAPPSFSWAGPMDTARLQVGFGTPGDRPEIGFLNEYEAYFLLTGGTESSMRAVAEVAGSIPLWVRDASTGALADVHRRPYLAQLYDSNSGNDKIPTAALPANTDPLYNNYFRTEVSHFPSLAFVMWLLTDDPFHLESCQAVALNAMTESNYHNYAYSLPGLGAIGETRAWAWAMRELFRLSGFCPATVPSWLLPRSAWKACVDDNLTVITQSMNGQGEIAAVYPLQLGRFHNWTQANYISAFQQDFTASVVGWAAWTGLFPDWMAAFNWLAYPRLSQMNDHRTSPGWDRRWCVPYDVEIPTSPVPADWSALWDAYVANNIEGLSNAVVAGWPADALAPNISRGYVAECRSALASLSLGGIAGARAAHDWLIGQCTEAFFEQASYPSTYKWSVVP